MSEITVRLSADDRALIAAAAAKIVSTLMLRHGVFPNDDSFAEVVRKCEADTMSQILAAGTRRAIEADRS